MTTQRFVLVVLAAIGLVVLTAGCGTYNATDTGARAVQDGDQNLVNQYYPVLRDAVPYPVAKMKYSLERANIRERLLRFNNPNKIGYVYLLYPTGQVAGYYTIKGKVSSTDSQMTTQDQVVKRCDTNVTGCVFLTVRSPGDDGSYGVNEPGIFFFTTEDVIDESNLLYFYSDAPLKLNEQKFIVYSQDVPQPSSVGESLQERQAMQQAALLATPVPTPKPGSTPTRPNP